MQDQASDACQETKSHLGNPYFIGDQPAGTQVSGWFAAWTPKPSAYAVVAQNSRDVAAAVDFARNHHLRLVVKGGGHSYQGTSNAPDSLLIWTRAMQQCDVHDAFIPQGCEGMVAPMKAVSVAAGMMWMDVYDRVTTQAGRYVQGGGCATVGVAGLVQSGGFGSFSKRFGTAAASLIEAEIVTSDGKIRIVNQGQDPELLWALKGGGGGSFGVVTRLTLKTHDLPDYLGAASGAIQARSDDAFRRLISHFMAFYRDSLCNPHWGESATIGAHNALRISMVCQGLDSEAAKIVWRPFFDWVRGSPQDFTITDELWVGARPGRDWWDVEGRRKWGSDSVIFDDRPAASPLHGWWRGDQEQVGAYLHGYESLWLPADLLTDPARLGEALFNASRATDFQLHFNKGLAGAPAEALRAAADTATNPAVIAAFALAIVANGGAPRYDGLAVAPDADLKAKSDATEVDRAIHALRAVAPEPGSYVSESNFFLERWSAAFWGAHYPRLLAAKRRYDPDGLFFVRHGVGSEEWSDDGFIKIGG